MEIDKQTAELEKLQRLQRSGNDPLVPANKNSDYLIQATATDRYHVRLSKQVHNPDTRSYDTVERIQVLYPKDFMHMVETQAFSQANWYEVEVIHKPEISAEEL